MDKKAYIAHIGDSRIYRWDGKKLHQLTEDHSIVAELVRNGALSKRKPWCIPTATRVDQVFGNGPQEFFDLKRENLKDGDIPGTVHRRPLFS